MNDFDYIICGNNIAAMTAAVTLAKRHTVAIVNPSPNWGGVFAGVKINDTQFDIGMCFLEFSSFYPQSDDLASYNPAVHNDSARFLNIVKRFCEQRIDVVETGNLKTLWRGVFYDDICIANQLQILSAFPADLKKIVALELENIIAKGRQPLHAAHKKSNPALFMAATYREASVLNHGETLHNFLFSPFCRKTLNISTHDFPALFHRVAWCPLYYPETLLAALRGEKPTMPKTHFHYPSKGHFVKIIDALLAEMRDNKNVTVIQDKPSKLNISRVPMLSFVDGGTATAKEIIWSGDLRQLQSLLPGVSVPAPMEKSSMTLVFMETDKKAVAQDFSTAFVCDDDVCVYRVTSQNLAHHNADKNKFIFEMNSAILEQRGINSDEQIIAHVQEFTEKASIFNTIIAPEQFAVKRFNNALTLPTKQNNQRFEDAQAAIKETLPGVRCIGPAASFHASSFNDQVIAALQLEHQHDTN